MIKQSSPKHLSQRMKFAVCSIFFSLAFIVCNIAFLSSASANGLVKLPNNLGLAAYYSMEDGAGTKATDFSGNGNTGTLTNGPVFVAGKRGKALSLDGLNDYVDLGSGINITTQGSFCLWYNLNSTADNYAEILTKESGTIQFTIGRYANTDRLYFYDGTNTDTTALGYGYNQWVHLCVVINSGALQYYLNGVAADTGTTLNPLNTLSASTRIGINNGQNFKGLVDEVRIYNRALGATEVAALYNSGAAALNRSVIGPAAGNLISWHTFDGSKLNSTTSTDSSSGGHNGTLSGGPTVARGKTGQALSFDGSNDYVNFGAPAINYASTDWTVSAWVKFNTLGTQTSIFGYGNGDAGNSRYWQVRKLANNTLQFGHYAGAGNDLTAGSAVMDTNWHFILVKQVSTTRTVYVDGVSDITQTSALSVPNTVQDDTRLGYPIWTSGSDNYFPGVIDDFRIYNRALSTTEIAQLYGVRGVTVNKSVVGGPGTSGLVLWHTFDGPKLNTTTSTDSVSAVNNGTLSGGPVPTRGKIGQAISFDGVDDYIDISNAADDVASGDITISAWVKFPAAYNTGSACAAIFRNGDNPSDNDINLQFGNWTLFSAGPGKLAFAVYDSAFHVASSSQSSWEAGRWYHVAGSVVSGSSGPIKLYVDGSLVDTASMAGARGSSPSTHTYLGANVGSASTCQFNEIIDDVRVYNRALSAVEILQLYNLGK